MTKIEIKHRFTAAVLYTHEVDDNEPNKLRAAVTAAISARANLARANLARADLARADLAGAYLADAYLADADLADADLAGADLAGANLARANLARANLADAYLAGADLAGANLARANLARANLADANLAGANLAGANLAGAYLADAYLAGAYLADANLAGADLAGADLADANLADANLADAIRVPPGVEAKDPPEPYVRPSRDYAAYAARYRERHPEVPVVEKLDSRILELVDSGKGVLDMSQWHTCETTHCRAGWAIALAGEAGEKLEQEYGPRHAGAMIYRASTGRSPHFFASDEQALEDIRVCAERETETPK